MVRGVGAEVLQHHGEEVFARKALRHLRALGRHGERVAVVDHHRFHLRAESRGAPAQQVVADGAHVDDSRQLAGGQVGPLQPGVALGAVEPAAAREQQATGTMPPCAHHARQHGDQAHRITTAAHTLHAVVEADGRRARTSPRGPVLARQLSDDTGIDATHRRRALGRPGQRARAQRLKAIDMALDVVVVKPVVGDELVHQRQRQRAVGAGQERDVLVALLRRLTGTRVDADEPRPGALGLLRIVPEMHAARDGVAAPDEDQAALGIVLHVHADLGAVGGNQRLTPGVGADRAVEPAGAQPVPEARGHALALHQAHRAGIAVGQDRLGVARGDGLQTRRDIGKRFVPAHRHEAPFTLLADAPQRRQHAFRVIGALGIAADLGAQHAMRGGVLGVAGHAGDAATLHGDLQRAGVGAVVRAGGLHHGGLGAGGVGKFAHGAECFTSRPHRGESIRVGGRQRARVHGDAGSPSMQ